jgi:hypothetical protein
VTLTSERRRFLGEEAMLRWTAICLAAASMGCTTTGMTTAFRNSWESMKRRPNRMIVSVAPNFVERDGFPFHQGMLVRVHFFLNDEPITMRADGEMTFVAYDKGKNGDNPTPVGLYRISNEEMLKHLRHDIVGDTYVFWLPYEPESPTQMVVNASFKPKYGDPYTSEPSVVHLTPLKQAVASANEPDKKRPRPNYVAFDSQAPKQTATVSTISLNNKPGAAQIETIGGARPLSGAAVQQQAAPPPQQPPKTN